MKSNRFIKRLDWYIIKKFLGTYVFAIALIISIAVVFDFNEKMDKLMEHEARCLYLPVVCCYQTGTGITFSVCIL